MKTKVIRIGNSRGIRIPKALLTQTGIKDEVSVTVRNGSLVIHPARKPRAGWAKSFAAMAQAGDDALIDEGLLPSTRWDEHEWEW